MLLRDDVHNVITYISRTIDNLNSSIINIPKYCSLPSDVNRYNELVNCRDELVKKNNELTGTVIQSIDSEMSFVTCEIERLEREEREERERQAALAAEAKNKKLANSKK